MIVYDTFEDFIRLIGRESEVASRLRDEDLVKRALEGDDSAFRELHDRYIGQVFRYAYLQTGDYHRSEEIAQDVMYKMAVNLATYKGKSSFKTWLFTIGRRVVIDYYRKYRKDRALTYLQHDQLNKVRDRFYNEQEFLQYSSQEKLLSCLEKLSPGEKTVLYMRFFEGLSIKETAKVMSKTVMAVKSMQTRAKKKLLFHLQSEVNEEYEKTERTAGQ